jgi:hypothetical protein
LDFNDGFPCIEVENLDGWLVQIMAHLHGKNNLHHALLQEEGRPKYPVGEDGKYVEQTAAAKKLLTKSQELWDVAGRAPMADRMHEGLPEGRRQQASNRGRQLPDSGNDL